MIDTIKRLKALSKPNIDFILDNSSFLLSDNDKLYYNENINHLIYETKNYKLKLACNNVLIDAPSFSGFYNILKSDIERIHLKFENIIEDINKNLNYFNLQNN